MLKTVPILLFAIFSSFFLRSQNIDSLRQQLLIPNLSDTTRVNIFLELSAVKDSTLYYRVKALTLAEKIKYYPGIAKSLIRIGIYYNLNSEYQIANQYFKRAIAVCKGTNLSKILVTALFEYGVCQRFQANFDSALHYNFEALALSQQMNMRRQSIIILIETSHLYRRLENYPEALKYIKLALKESNEIATSNHIKGNLSDSMAGIQLDLKNYDEALKYYLLGLSYFEKSGFAFSIMTSKSNIASCLLEMERFDEARPYVEESYKLINKTDFAELKASANIDMGKIKLHDGDLDSAIFYFKQSLLYSANSKYFFRARDAYIILAQLHSNRGEYKKAAQYWEKAFAVNDSLYNEKLVNASAKAQKNYEVSRRQSQIDQLSKDAEIKDLQLQRERTLKYFLFTGLTLLGLAASFAWYAFYVKTKLHKELSNRSELKALRSQINPHFIFNSLNVIQDRILANHDQEAIQYLGDFSYFLRKVLNNSFSSFITLAEEIKTIGFYLKMESVRFEHSFTWKIIVDERIDPTLVKIPPMLLQPLLENALIHGLLPKNSGERLLIIQFTIENDRLVCLIEDNGVGRPKVIQDRVHFRERHVSRGTQLINERINLLNKTFKLDSILKVVDIYDKDSVPAGTKVEISFDLKKL